MRIASSQLQATINTALQSANAGLAQVTEQMASGQRVMRPSDDTIASIQLSRLTREEASLNQYQSNIDSLKSRLTDNETIMTSMQKDMMQARDQLVWAADGSNSSSDLQAMASTLDALRDSLIHSANSTDSEGRAMFTGTATNQQAVDPAFNYNGNTNTQQVSVGPGVTLPANVPLPEIAGFAKQLDALSTLLKTGPTASAAQPTVRATLTLLDQTLNSVTGKVGSLGGLQTVLATMQSNQAAVSLSNKQASLTLGQLDYGEAATRLNSYTLAVQATQKAYGRVSGLSLFNAL